MFAVCQTSVRLTCLRNVILGEVESLWSHIQTTILSLHVSKDEAEKVVAALSRGTKNPLSTISPEQYKDDDMRSIEGTNHQEYGYNVLELSVGEFISLETGV